MMRPRYLFFEPVHLVRGFDCFLIILNKPGAKAPGLF
jgi:hypothetical protein